MSTREIADELNKNQWYQKKAGSPIDPFQIHGRTKNYAKLFNRDGSMVSLIGQSTKIEQPKIKKTIQPLKVLKTVNGDKPIDTVLLEKMLMNEKNFRSAAIVDSIIPDKPGLYCVRINDKSKLPPPFDKLLADRGHNIIYIGIASTSLKRRFLGQELRAMGHGTFFRSMGAILGFRPAKGSLTNKLNKRNYTFTRTDELKVIEWINKHLAVNWVEIEREFEKLETTLLNKYRPLVNISKNPSASNELTKLRAECVTIANCPQ